MKLEPLPSFWENYAKLEKNPKAQAENHRFGLPNIYSRNGKIIYEMPDGEIIVKKDSEIKNKIMTQPKKRPNKKAKAAQKILENSKLLTIAKTTTESKSDKTFKPTDSEINKTSEANKMRPNKKRG